MEIIIGCGLGILVALVAWVWIAQKGSQQQAMIAEEELHTTLKDKCVPLEKKLRDAIYDCEHQLKNCEKEIDKACQQQLELIKDVGKKSYVEVANKPLFFSYNNPISKQKHFYYTRDLHPDLPQEVLEKTSQLANQYQKHIDLLSTQQEIFKQLLLSHKENLARLAGITEQEGQLGKIKNYKKKLAELEEEQQSEEQAIYGELLLGDIAEELHHQEECMRQYIDLSNTYQCSLNQVVDDSYQQKLQYLLTQLEIPPPSQKD